MVSVRYFIHTPTSMHALSVCKHAAIIGDVYPLKNSFSVQIATVYTEEKKTAYRSTLQGLRYLPAPTFSDLTLFVRVLKGMITEICSVDQ